MLFADVLMVFGLKLQLERHKYGHVVGGKKRKCLYIQVQNISMCVAIIVIYINAHRLKITQDSVLGNGIMLQHFSLLFCLSCLQIEK